jgi:hypothetical protein
MKYYQEINGPHCDDNQLGKAEFSAKGVQHYFCKNKDGKTNTFMLEYSSKVYEVVHRNSPLSTRF